MSGRKPAWTKANEAEHVLRGIGLSKVISIDMDAIHLECGHSWFYGGSMEADTP